MDAKSKMGFINSLGSNAICPCCEAEVQADDVFCSECGTQIPASAPKRQAVQNTVVTEPPPEQQPAPAQVVIYKEEAPAVFASGLPKWSIEPPAVVVRRRARR